MLAGIKFRSNEDVIGETESYFKAKYKPFYKSGIEIEKLELR